MAVVATVTLTFILVGEINTLAPIVTMPFLLTYACIDYSYFALAQTFDIQHQREARYSSHQYASTSPSEQYSSPQEKVNDLDTLFPERTRHKTLGVRILYKTECLFRPLANHIICALFLERVRL